MGSVIRTELVCATAVALLSCQRSEPPKAPVLDELSCSGCNLLLVSLTNVRKDHLSAYGYERPTSPNLSRRFADAFKFERAYSPASWTLPVTASVYTSRYPYEHGAMMRYTGVQMSEEELTLAEVLRQSGYRTIGITGGGDHNRKYNVAQGFDLYVDEENYAGLGIFPQIDLGVRTGAAYLGIERLVPVATRWLTQNAQRKFFMVFNGFDAHCPFRPRTPYDTMYDPDYGGAVDFDPCLWTFEPVEPIVTKDGKRWPVRTSVAAGDGKPEILLNARDITQMVALYDGEITQADHDLEKLLLTFEHLGLLENTLVVFFSEHGDLFGEHGRFMRGGPHRGTFYEPVLNVPLLILHPRRKGTRIDGLVSLADLMPTLLELLQVSDPAPSTRRGHSLVPLLRDPHASVNQHVYAASAFVPCENPFFNSSSASEVVRGDRYKLLVEAMGDRTERLLFDLQADPAEEQDISAREPQVLARLQASLEAFFAASRRDRWRSNCP